MFRIVPIDPSMPSDKNRGRPLHVSLSTSTHDHTDPDQAGIILTIGRTGCDVNFPNAPIVKPAETASRKDRTRSIDAKIIGWSIHSPLSERLHVDVRTDTLESVTRAAAWHSGCSYSQLAPYDCNIRGLDEKRIQKLPLNTPLAELAPILPLNFRLTFEYTREAAVRPTGCGPTQILRLVANRRELIQRTWKSPAAGGGIRRFMPARNDAENKACDAAADGIILVVEQGGDCDPRTPWTNIFGGKQELMAKVLRFKVEAFGRKNWDNRSLDVCLYADSPVRLLMIYINQERRVPPEFQRLWFRGRALDDPTKTLADCGIQRGSVVLLNRRQKADLCLSFTPTKDDPVKSTWATHKITINESVILTSLSLPSDNDVKESALKHGPMEIVGTTTCKTVAVELGCMRAQSSDRIYTVEIERVPLNLCPSSSVAAKDLSSIRALAPSLGISLADSAIGFNPTPCNDLLRRTHLLMPSDETKQKSTIKSLSAWCLNVPIVTTDFVLEGLAKRRNSQMPLIDANRYVVWGGRSGISYSDAIIDEENGNGPCHGRRDPLKGFLFVSLAPMEVEGLVLAAGAVVYRAYMLDTDAFYSGKWIDELRAAEENPKGEGLVGGRVVVINSQLRKTRSHCQLLASLRLPIVSSHQIFTAITKMQGVVFDDAGNTIEASPGFKSLPFRTEWLIATVPMDGLPSDAIRLIFNDYIGGAANDILSLVRISTCSKGLQRCIFQDSPFLWEEINMNNVEEKYQKRFRDKHLEAILRRSNSVLLTQRLSLNGCRALRGSGIAPLRGSTMLKEIYLTFRGGEQTHRDPILDADTICEVLGSMPPLVNSAASNPLIGLKRIEFDSLDFDRPVLISKNRRASKDKLEAFLVRFGSLSHATRCVDCQIPIRSRVEEITGAAASENWISSEARICFCPHCKGIVCGNKDSGCRKVNFCDSCGSNGCNKCQEMEECRLCEEIYCVDCSEVTKCGQCNLGHCEDCAFGGEIETTTCEACGEIRCSLCREMDFCDKCNLYICRNQNDMIRCACCDNTYCGDCKKMDFCNSCQGFFCPSCPGRIKCRDCETYCCATCMAASCEACKEYVCTACDGNNEASFGTTCDVCKEDRCRICAPECPVEGCAKTICRDCSTFRPACQLCKAKTCNDHRSICTAGDCKASYCDACVEKSFDDETRDNLGVYCSHCEPNSFLCQGCHQDHKYGICSVCSYSFRCTTEGCSPSGRNQRWCTVCNVRYCLECSSAHKEVCQAPDDPNAEEVWSYHFNCQFTRRIKRFRKHWHHYGEYYGARRLKEECTDDNLEIMSNAEKMILAEKVYQVVTAKHGSVDVLDIGLPSIQPRINTVFPKL